MINRKISIAPMMGHTDRHFRYFMRLLSKHAVLYTEMITTNTLIHGDRRRFLQFNSIEHPLAIQLAGNNSDDLTECAHIAESEGYDEINLNIGCPSNRVQHGQFGACLMANAELVGECVNKIKSKVSIPVTIKTRIGIDNKADYMFLDHFISTTNKAGCDTYIIHARKAILTNLSPKENRDIPPLHYDRVYQIKQNYHSLNITINGGINELTSAINHLKSVDGIMIGRAAYRNPYFIAELDKAVFKRNDPLSSRQDILEKYKGYVAKQVTKGECIKSLMRHIIGLYYGETNARLFRRALSDTIPGKEKQRFFDNLMQHIIKKM